MHGNFILGCFMFYVLKYSALFWSEKKYTRKKNVPVSGQGWKQLDSGSNSQHFLEKNASTGPEEDYVAALVTANSWLKKIVLKVQFI